MGPVAVSAAALATLLVACAHGIDTELDLSGEDGGPPIGPTTGPTSGTGGNGGGAGSVTSGTGGRGDPTGVGGSSSTSTVSSSVTSGGGGGASGGAAGSTSAGASGGAGIDAGAGAAGQGGTGGGTGGTGGAAGSGGTGGAGGSGGSAVRDAGPLVTIDDATTGTGNNQFNYVGTWGHCNPCTTASTPPLHAMTNSWAGGGDASGTEYLTFAFVGSELHFYGVKDPRNGIGGVSIDGAAETKVDFYAATRAGNTLLFSSPTLAQGTHTFKLRVTSTKNTASSGTTVTVDRIDVR
jgi:hypothetical protein